MKVKECVAMLLAGGEGRRLGPLTRRLAKPAVPFGGKYRIIDFVLSNCANSGIDTVGVLTQYQPLILNSYIGIGSAWDLDRRSGGVTVLPPFVSRREGSWYKGTANAIYQNTHFIEGYNPKYVLVVSGDHIYKMNYTRLLQYHKEKKADATIAVIEVPWKEASRFGIMSTDAEKRITQFTEKPGHPDSNLASMGIYIFTWDVLKKYLELDEANPASSHDFGKDVIPAMLRAGCNMMAYPFSGYWKDVGTIESLWEAHMDLLSDTPALDMNDASWRIYSVNPQQPPQYIAAEAEINRSLINEGCAVWGKVERSVLFYGVKVGAGSIVRDSVIMPHAKIGRNVVIEKAIIGEGAVIEDGVRIGGKGEEISLVPEKTVVHSYRQTNVRAAGLS
jgi:glucose-1-phosphate adenylyltransferase